jgi:hypothetical protein
MSDFKVEIYDGQPIKTKNVLFVENRNDGYSSLYGEPSLIRRAVFYLQDDNWEGWFFHDIVRENYVKILTDKTYKISIHDDMMNIGWIKTLKHLKVEGVEIQEVNPSVIGFLKDQYGN